ncbi:hypothetical protein M948_18235 [Virgibacillus sp. CM-4]|uniref:hypothetical protein n=1 Tax=Virgibacillus sp. CM-4 TaxID=1354277 RepID=UPI00038878E0|nr:hypothetical protein [Virgibacillus sp. CM-4]EQB35039.1 hypothetical protein M948_18235 [Virgibacillus sp. CM-4]
MPYKVINEFIDKDHKDTHYKPGDDYPVDGYKPTQKRIKELSQNHKKYKRVFIEEVKEDNASDDKTKNKETKKPSSKK